jgi:transcriptional regulator with XRE-family HTH domain
LKRQSARKILAQNLRARRAALGISQEELADRAGLHRTYVGSIERCERNISIDNIEKLADALETTVAALLAPQ